jgi:hypothetical protein
MPSFSDPPFCVMACLAMSLMKEFPHVSKDEAMSLASRAYQSTENLKSRLEDFSDEIAVAIRLIQGGHIGPVSTTNSVLQTARGLVSKP